MPIYSSAPSSPTLPANAKSTTIDPGQNVWDTTTSIRGPSALATDLEAQNLDLVADLGDRVARLEGMVLPVSLDFDSYQIVGMGDGRWERVLMAVYRREKRLRNTSGRRRRNGLRMWRICGYFIIFG